MTPAPVWASTHYKKCGEPGRGLFNFLLPLNAKINKGKSNEKEQMKWENTLMDLYW